MKKRIVTTLALIGLISLSTLTACQATTKNFGGSMTLKLEPNQKLEEITWKDNSLWYLTRPMTKDDVAETHTFHQSSQYGVFEGTVTIVETKEVNSNVRR